MRVAVSGRPDVPRRVDLAREVVATWEKISGQTPEIEQGLSKELGEGPGVPLERLDTDTIITVGGDGTLLYTLKHNQAQILGVNDGELGFLTEVPPDKIEEALTRLHEGDFFIEDREKLQVRLNDKVLGHCTNEVVVKSPHPSKILRFSVHAGDHEIENVRADGIILATPTGSTSYALSAGGPMVHPQIDSLLVVPLAPFRVSLRPMILPSTTTLRVELVEDQKKGIMALDGQEEHWLRPDDELTITRSDHTARFIRFQPHFFSRMRELFG